MSHALTLSILGFKVSPFTIALISPIPGYIQTGLQRLADERVGVAHPSLGPIPLVLDSKKTLQPSCLNSDGHTAWFIRFG